MLQSRRIRTGIEMQIPKTRNKRPLTVLVIGLLFLILVLGASLRLVGLDWDSGKHLHPDERFLSMVTSAIKPVERPADYFDTANSTLNPANSGYKFFVYGTFPIFIIRYIAEWTGQTGYDSITILGRQLSALTDVFTILIVFLIGLKLYRWQVGMIAAGFYAFAVLPIQQSHFMTVDTFTNFFGALTVYVAVLILTEKKNKIPWLKYAFFGCFLGMATASKINAASLAFLLPLSLWARSRHEGEDQPLLDYFWPVVMAALVSLVTFRVLQPYAFEGPGFFNLKFNPLWQESLLSLREQASGRVDFPPALQWAKRPIGFAFENTILWGMGLFWGITALAGLISQIWDFFTKKNWNNFPLLVWLILYFLWQGTAWVRAMRYLLLGYPLLALIAAWFIDELLQLREPLIGRLKPRRRFKPAILGVIVLIITVLGSGLWAFAFTRIYTRPHTRVAASAWIYEHIPGVFTLSGKDPDGNIVEIPGQMQVTDLEQEQVKDSYFQVHSSFDGQLEAVLFQESALSPQDQINRAFGLELIDSEDPAKSYGALPARLLQDENGQSYWSFAFQEPVYMPADKQFLMILTNSKLTTPLPEIESPVLQIVDGSGQTRKLSQAKALIILSDAHSIIVNFPVNQILILEGFEISRLEWLQSPKLSGTLTASISMDGSNHLIEYQAGKIWSGVPLKLEFDKPFEVHSTGSLSVKLELTGSGGLLGFRNPAIAVESTWDDGLPLPMNLNGQYLNPATIYETDLNLEAYWPDTTEKRERIAEVLDRADYLVMSSNRQYGTISRVPERYPLMSSFYRELLGCSENEDTLSCYNEAEALDEPGPLGFRLMKTFTSYPELGPFVFNDQYAEEAFSVYDHPKVMIFEKTDNYSSSVVSKILNQVDLSKAINLPPGELGKAASSRIPADGLMLDKRDWEKQQEGGTWAELFIQDSLVNRSQVAAVIIFYIFTLVLTWAVFPLIWPFFKGLPDGAYPLARTFSYLLFGFLGFTAGALRIPVTRALLAMLFILLIGLGAYAMFIQRDALKQMLQVNKKEILIAEVVGLLAFAFFLWIRWLNPDLWHPYHGGEKPMDFSYFNAVIKSSTFPAYDPWFAGGYLNYYYFGMVLAGLPTKLLGITPAVAINIILPLWFSMVAMAAYSLGFNLVGLSFGKTKNAHCNKQWARFAGIIAVILVLVAGNLGTVKLLQETARTMGAYGQDPASAGWFMNLKWLVKGLLLILKGEPLPLYPGTWYWNPSRTIADTPITEFPLFTFLYADPHAHLYAMPFVLLAVAWALNALFVPKLSKPWIEFLYLGLGALIIGVLKPVNTWDFYTLFTLGACVLLYVEIFSRQSSGFVELSKKKSLQIKLIRGLGAIVFLFFASSLLYYTFNSNFHPAFSKIAIWKGLKTTLSEYLTHWGFFLFILFWWYLWESYKWLAITPMSQVRKLKRYSKQIFILCALGLAILFTLSIGMKIQTAVIILPFCLWTLALISRKEISHAERFVLFLIGTALIITLFVEIVYLLGDNGRQNIVFKFYMQAWLFFAVGSAYALTRLISEFNRWRLRTQNIFLVTLGLMGIAVLLFPVTAAADKATNRMDPGAAHSLDGMLYMRSSRYHYGCQRSTPEAECVPVEIDLAEDYRAIQWMQANLFGSPVIIEGYAGLYTWSNRFTVYTGLPGVIGWDYHQSQQRGILANDIVGQRVRDVELFYQTIDPLTAYQILQEYGVTYVIVGQYEKALYFQAGLDKFAAWDGALWDTIYQDGQTAIYKVR